MIKKVLIVTLLMFLTLNFWSQQDKAKGIKEKEEKMLKEIMETHGRVDFIGRVVDQNGEGVEGAIVNYSYTYFCYGEEWFQCIKYGSVRTDKNGYLEIKVAKAQSLDIDGIFADGYDSGYNGKGFKGDFIYFKSSPYFNCQGNKSNPAIFQIRKKGEPTMLLSTHDSLSFLRGEETEYALCFATHGYWYTKDFLENAMEKGKRIDLIVSGKYENGMYILRFNAVGDKSAGIVMRENRVYSAPEDNYKAEVEMTIKEEKDFNSKTAYLYVKSGNPLVYTELEMKMRLFSDSGKLKIEYSSYTNPFGEKNLEGGWRMYGLKEYNEIKDGVERALYEGRYPHKIDFKSLEEKAIREYSKSKSAN